MPVGRQRQTEGAAFTAILPEARGSICNDPLLLWNTYGSWSKLLQKSYDVPGNPKSIVSFDRFSGGAWDLETQFVMIVNVSVVWAVLGPHIYEIEVNGMATTPRALLLKRVGLNSPTCEDIWRPWKHQFGVWMKNTCSNHMESQAKVGSDLGTKNQWANSPCMDWGWIYLPGITKIVQNWPDFVFPPPNSTHLPKEEPNTFCTPQCDSDKMNQNSIGIHPAGGL